MTPAVDHEPGSLGVQRGVMARWVSRRQPTRPEPTSRLSDSRDGDRDHFTVVTQRCRDGLTPLGHEHGKDDLVHHRSPRRQQVVKGGGHGQEEDVVDHRGVRVGGVSEGPQWPDAAEGVEQTTHRSRQSP